MKKETLIKIGIISGVVGLGYIIFIILFLTNIWNVL